MKKKYDVVVAGAGVAGVAAALASARCGAKTALLEKTVLPGGLATSGLVLMYLPLCDGRGHQVTFGISQELFQLANEYGPADIPADWQQEQGSRLEVYFSPASFVLSMDKLLVASGVDIWFDTLAIDAKKDASNQLKSISVANKSGIIELEAHTFVDATGDSDLAHFAGNSCLLATNSRVTWVIEHREKKPSSSFVFGKDVSTNMLSDPIDSVFTAPGVNGRMVSDFMLKSREKYRRILDDDYSQGVESRKSRYPLTLPSMPPLRHTRCIQGKTVLQPGSEWKYVSDSIGLAADWRYRDKVWEIPFSSLIPDNINGLVAAGRCTSALGDAWEITRVIPAAAMTGEAAGAAAALAWKHQISVEKLPIQILQNYLQSLNIPLHCQQGQ